MKRLIPLFVMGTAGMVGAFFPGQDTLVEQAPGQGLSDATSHEAMIPTEESDEPVQISEWLASDVTRVSLSPTWKKKEGKTAEIMRAYADLHEARQQSAALNEASKKANKHLETKELTIRHLVAGDIHLLDAAREWQEEDRSYGLCNLEMLRRHYPGNTDIERYCHRIIWELEVLEPDNPQLFRAARTKAREELRVLKMQGSLLSSN